MSKITKEEIKRLIVEEGLNLKDMIDAVIELNHFVGVGVITLGDDLRQYCLDAISAPRGNNENKL